MSSITKGVRVMVPVAKGVEIDGEQLGGDGTVPLLLMFGDHDRNVLMLVEGG